MDKTRIAVVGLGGRGSYHAFRLATKIENTEVVAVCDLYQDRVDETCKNIEEATGKRPDGYTDYNEMFRRGDIEGVLIATSWTTHTRIAVAAMKAGIRPATEVHGATSIEECWSVVRTSEETGVPAMFLENCSYGREELCLLNMARLGLFGEITHCEGGYEHCLRDEITMGNENRHYRFNNYAHRNGDVYPTHALGPMAKILNINRGNRFVSIVSVASKQCGLNEFARDHFGDAHPANNTKFALGDVVTSIIKCAGGETITLNHDTSSFRPYSRGGKVQGTHGLWTEANASICLERDGKEEWRPFAEYMEKYDHPIWQKFKKNAVENGYDGMDYRIHVGMDYISETVFVDSVRRGIHPPIDVYDWAAWTATTILSEQSVALGGVPQLYPDFTNGSWLDGTMPKCTSEFNLN